MSIPGTRFGPRWLSAFTGKQFEEKDTCLNCPLPDCVGRDQPECPLRAVELIEKERQQRAQDKAALDRAVRVLAEFGQDRIVGKAVSEVRR